VVVYAYVVCLKWFKNACAYLWMNCMDCTWLFLGAECVKQWERTDILAQASSSRLGENSRSLPWFCSSVSLKRKVLVLSDVLSRSGENGSPKWALEETWCSLVESSSRRGIFGLGEEWSRSGEAVSPKRELVECHCNALAQAR